MSNISPPPFVEKFQYRNCQQVNLAGSRVYVTPDGDRVPSVTTILSATKDMTALNEWKKRVGEENAKQISKEASGVGTAMHANLERFMVGLPRQPGGNLVHIQANKMAEVIINNGLANVNEVWAMEQSLYFPGLYSGTTDLVCVHKDQPCIADYKQTNKPKKAEWIEDYYLQLMGYMLAHNEVYGSDIRKGVVFMCSRNLEYQQFEMLPCDFNKYQDMWLNKVETYYASLN